MVGGHTGGCSSSPSGSSSRGPGFMSGHIAWVLERPSPRTPRHAPTPH